MSPAQRTLALALVLGWATPAMAIDVDASVRLLNRFVFQENAVQTVLGFDPVDRRFVLENYLSPRLRRYSSTHLLGIGLDVDLGEKWGFVAALDSGVLRYGEENRTLIVPLNIGMTRRFFLPVTLESTELRLTANGLPVTDEASRSLFLRQAYFTYEPAPWVHLVVGKRRFIVADGFLLDQFSLGVGLHLNGTRRKSSSPWRVEVSAYFPDGSFDGGGKKSPLAHVAVQYVPGPFQHIGFLGAYFHDGNNILSQVFRTAITEGTIERVQAGGAAVEPLVAQQVPLASSGDIGWLGLSGKRFFGNHTIGGTALVQVGRISNTVTLPPAEGSDELRVRTVKAKTLGFFFDLYYQYDVTENVVVGGFTTYASGDDRLSRALSAQGEETPPTLDAFLSIFPFVSRSNLFFSGGLNAEFSGRKAATIGVNARGLIAVGANARWEHRRFTLSGNVAFLGAPRPSIYDGQYYGTEIDLNLKVPAGSYVSFVTEFDTLITGSFFASQKANFQLIVGVDLRIP